MNQNTDIKEKEGSALRDAELIDDLIDDASEKNLEVALKKGFRTPSVKVTVKLLLAALLIASISIFVTGLMKFSELQKEKESLEEELMLLMERWEELSEELGE